MSTERWVDDALCAQVDGELFFPEKGGSTKPAKAVCARCSVRQPCLEDALATFDGYGIRGGLSERERRKLKAHRVGPVELDMLREIGRTA